MEKNKNVFDNSMVLELACNLAHNALCDKFDIGLGEGDDLKLFDFNIDGTNYKEEFQEIFDEFYDYYYDEITKIFKIQEE